MEQQPTYETASSRVWHVQTADSSDGAVHEQIVEYFPESPFPPMHYHPAQDEHFVVERGSMLFVIDGEEQVVEVGEAIDVPRGTPHKARNASTSKSALVHWETRPALRTHEYRDVFRPVGAVGALVPVVGRLARLLGVTLPDSP